MNSEYREGFVEQCVESGLNRDQTEELYKIAFYASSFDNENFQEGFLSQTVPIDLDKFPMMTKAELVKRAAHDEYGA